MVTTYSFIQDGIESLGDADSPIHLVPGSHKFGATVFPHDLTDLDGGSQLRYRADEEHVQDFPVHRVVGKAGDRCFCHSCVLHGTQLHTGNVPRVSIRYIIQKDSADSDTLLDQTNLELEGSRMIEKTRVDIDETGAFQLRSNVISGNSSDTSDTSES